MQVVGACGHKITELDIDFEISVSMCNRDLTNDDYENYFKYGLFRSFLRYLFSYILRGIYKL